ncbi:unnamed protein product, partial [Laminaria digitata]
PLGHTVQKNVSCRGLCCFVAAYLYSLCCYSNYDNRTVVVEVELHAAVVEVQRGRRGGARGGSLGCARLSVWSPTLRPAWDLPACSPVACGRRTRTRRGWWCLCFYSVLILMADMGKNSCEQVGWLVAWLVGRLVSRLVGWSVGVAMFSGKLSDHAVFSRKRVTRPVWYGSSLE